MIETILKERSMELALETLNKGLEVGVETNVYMTDFTSLTDEELIKFTVDTDTHLYNVFLREKRFNNKELQPILYKNIAKAIIKCKEENINHYNELLFLIVRNDVFDFVSLETKNVVLDIEKAKNLYNILINDEIRELNIESFKKKFKHEIFNIGDISVINILNIIYLLSA